MKGSARILLAVLSAALIVAACSRGPKIIPGSKMEKICADMMMADQWVGLHTSTKFAIDTSLFYEPIFRKYGYTTDDFNASIEYYMRDPLKFSRMMKNVALKLEAEADRLIKEENIEMEEGLETQERGFDIE